MLEIVAAAVTAAGRLFSAAWSFFVKPPGLYLGAALLGAGLLLFSYQAGRSSGKAACLQTQAAAQTARNAKIATQSAAVAVRAVLRGAANAAIDAQTRETVRYVKQQAAALPDGAIVCIPSAVADRLRGLE
jgi:hypothetical protein